MRERNFMMYNCTYSYGQLRTRVTSLVACCVVSLKKVEQPFIYNMNIQVEYAIRQSESRNEGLGEKYVVNYSKYDDNC